MSTLNLRMKLKLNLVINHEPLGLYGLETRAYLIKGRGESLKHVHMKLLSYIAFYHEDLLIEAKADQHYKPDLVRFDLRGEPVQWVDCGKTSLRKLDVITRKNTETYIDIVKPTKGELALYKIQADEALARPERARYWSFGRPMMQALAQHVRGRHTIHATVSEGYEHLYLLIDESISINGPITRLHEVQPEDME